MAAQAIKLPVAGQIRCAVTAQHAAEDAQMIGYPLRQAHICAGSQVKSTATPVLLMKKLQQLAVIRQVHYIEGNLIRHVRLEGRLAMQEPARQAQHPKRVRADQNQQRIDKSVGLDQRSI
jgi:hypothetical protein